VLSARSVPLIRTLTAASELTEQYVRKHGSAVSVDMRRTATLDQSFRSSRSFGGTMKNSHLIGSGVVLAMLIFT
jgi:hypothetical protein